MSAQDFADWRKKCQLTQEQAAAEMGVTPKLIRDMEHGRRGITKRTELACKYLEMVGAK